MTKIYIATKDEIIRAYKTLAEISPSCTESSSTTDIFQAMATPSRLACNIINSNVYPASSGTLAINKTSNNTGTAIFIDAEGRVSTGVFPWSGWQSPGYSNPNLLVNWDFRQSVNQRRQSSYTDVGYMIDMWFINKSSVYEIETVVNDKYISLKPTGGNIWICQKFEDSLCDDKIYTASVAYPNGEIKSIQINTENSYKTIDDGLQVNIGTKTIFELVALKDYPADIQAVKLEVGTVSTLAIDLKQPSDYAAELRRCKRYYQNILKMHAGIACEGVAASSSIAAFIIGEEMRINPSIICSGTPYLIINGEYKPTKTTPVVKTINGKIRLEIETDTTIEIGQNIALSSYSSNPFFLALSAEL